MDPFFIIAILLIVGIPVGLSLLTYWLIKKAGFDKRLRLISLLPVLTLCYFVYTAFYPTDSFYKDDFVEVTGTEFPETGDILYKIASYPNIHGDYQSAIVVKVDTDFYKALPDKLEEKGLIRQANKFDPFEIEDILNMYKDKTIDFEYWVENSNATIYYVGFMSDKKTIIVRRASW